MLPLILIGPKPTFVSPGAIALNKIVTLLNKLEGVNVVEAEYTDARIRIAMTIESHKSHLWLRFCSEATNIPLSAYCLLLTSPGSEVAEKTPELGVIYTFFIDNYEDSSEDFEYMNYLGARLAWLSHSAGILETGEANYLLKAWKAVSIEERTAIHNRICR